MDIRALALCLVFFPPQENPRSWLESHSICLEGRTAHLLPLAPAHLGSVLQEQREVSLGQSLTVMLPCKGWSGIQENLGLHQRWPEPLEFGSLVLPGALLGSTKVGAKGCPHPSWSGL